MNPFSYQSKYHKVMIIDYIRNKQNAETILRIAGDNRQQCRGLVVELKDQGFDAHPSHFQAHFLLKSNSTSYPHSSARLKR